MWLLVFRLYRAALFCLLALILPSRTVGGRAGWFSLGDAPSPTAPTVQIVRDTDDELVIEIRFAGFEHAPRDFGVDGSFVALRVPSAGIRSRPGNPLLPCLRHYLALPHPDPHLTYTMRHQQVSLMDLGYRDPVEPAQPPRRRSAAAPALIMDAAAYAANEWQPDPPVRLVHKTTANGYTLSMLEVTPIQYRPADGELRAIENMTLTLRFPDTSRAVAAPAASLSSSSAQVLRRLAINRIPETGIESTPGANRLLMICPDEFSTVLDPYVSWKTGAGWDVQVAVTSRTGSASAEIRTYIREQHQDAATQPDGLLLVGDVDTIPAFTGVTTDAPDTDLYYACMADGDDWHPVFPVGRWSAATAGQVEQIIAKTLFTATNRYAGWHTNTVFMAGIDRHVITESTHNTVISSYLLPRGYTADKVYRQTYNATTDDVAAAINAGGVLATFSGHGESDGWTDGPRFMQAQVNGLHNSNRYPFVFSFACHTGDYAIDEGFGETWLRAADRGAVAFLGASTYSYWDEDDIFEKRLYASIFDEGYSAIGWAVLRAKYLFQLYWGAGGFTRKYFEMYNLLGDPTLDIPGLPLTITTPARLDPTYRKEPYRIQLRAGGGTPPYTNWIAASGALPEGMDIDESKGILSGLPVTAGEFIFTVQLSDTDQATTDREFHLPVLDRLTVLSPEDLLTGSVGNAYRQTLRATGGSRPYQWHYAPGYAESGTDARWEGGGSPQTWRADDLSWSFVLPWPFPFYGHNRTSLWVSSNGFIDFESDDPQWQNSTEALAAGVIIAPIWDDLRTDLAADNDIYIVSNDYHVTIRWAAETWAYHKPVNVELVLERDGGIVFRYGAAHSGLNPTIGVSRGNNRDYTLLSLDGASSIPADVSYRFDYHALPSGLTLDADGVISGIPATTGVSRITASLNDHGPYVQAAAGTFRLAIDSDANSSGLPDAWEYLFWPDGDSGGATIDFDGNGMTNYEEWLAGTDPTDPLSVFKIIAFERDPDGWRLRWPSASNRFYRIDFSPVLPAPIWTILADDVPATPPRNEVPISPPLNGGGYYRIQVAP